VHMFALVSVNAVASTHVDHISRTINLLKDLVRKCSLVISMALMIDQRHEDVPSPYMPPVVEEYNGTSLVEPHRDAAKPIPHL